MGRRKYDYGQVQEIALKALHEKRPIGAAVAAELNISLQHANTAIVAARKANFFIPNVRKGQHSHIDPSTRLCCTCGVSFPIDDIRDLFRHTAREHRRVPTPEERTPRSAAWLAEVQTPSRSKQAATRQTTPSRKRIMI